MSYPAAIAERAMYAATCAYQIKATSSKAEPSVPVIRTVPSDDKDYVYMVAPGYQNPVGFVKDAAEYTPSFKVTGPDDINAGLIGLTHDNYAIVALRGTLPPNLTEDDWKSWIADWANDADAAPVHWQPYGKDWGHVATGFGKSAILLWPWIEETLEGLIDAASNGIIVCGHSKGGAMTFLVASLIATRWPDRAKDIQVHAFAPPVTGDTAFAVAYDAACDAGKTWRYQVEYDLVPFLPLWVQADVWQSIRFDKLKDEAAWLAFVESIRYAGLGGGYTAVGSFVYFDSAHKNVAGAEVDSSALPAVVGKIESCDVKTIAAAHGAAESYLPCFSGTAEDVLVAGRAGTAATG